MVCTALMLKNYTGGYYTPSDDATDGEATMVQSMESENLA